MSSAWKVFVYLTPMQELFIHIYRSCKFTEYVKLCVEHNFED